MSSLSPSTKNPLTTSAQIWSLAAQASEEDGDHPARPLHMHFLRQEHREAASRGHLALQGVQEEHGRRSLGRFVSLISRQTRNIDLEGWMAYSLGLRDRTPAAAATRSTIRRLREIAEV